MGEQRQEHEPQGTGPPGSVWRGGHRGPEQDYKLLLQGSSWVGRRGSQLGPGPQGELCGLPSQSP